MDDEPVVLAGLKAVLTKCPDLDWAGEASSAAGCEQAIRKVRPDVVLVDADLVGAKSFQFTTALIHSHPAIRVIAMTGLDDGTSVRFMIAAGAVGFVRKQSNTNTFVDAIRAAASGRFFLDPKLPAAAVRDLVVPNRISRAELLSKRESEVVRALAAGYTNSEIARRLQVSVKTVESYRARVREKLGLRTRSEIVLYALAKGISIS